MLLTKELIRKKRDNERLSAEEIQAFIDGVTDNSVTNEQIAAMAMAILLNDLSSEERKHLTLSMRNSGEVITFDNLDDKPIVDKHSTGGIGDLVSIPLAPIVAACGAYVPMITGKGLGHTGGTTDKLAAIAGYNLTPAIEKFKQVVSEVGCALIGQTTHLAPADRRIYAVRDTTGTVESIPLIASSILSKKLASGINYLVMDVKTGNGAFMTSFDKSKDLAKTIVDIAKSVNVPSIALITDMSEALSSNIGNALEIKESIEYLLGIKRESKLHEVILALGVEMILVTNLAKDRNEALEKINYALSSGKAAEVFEKMVAAMGGDKNILTNYNSLLPKANFNRPIYLKKSGYIKSINSRELGFCLVHLGGGRKSIDDTLDLAVGLENVLKIGDEVNKNRPFAILHYQKEEQYTYITNILNNIIEVTENPIIRKIKSIYEIIK